MIWEWLHPALMLVKQSDIYECVDKELASIIWVEVWVTVKKSICQFDRVLWMHYIGSLVWAYVF